MNISAKHKPLVISWNIKQIAKVYHNIISSINKINQVAYQYIIANFFSTKQVLNMFAESKRSGNMFNLDINTMRTDDLMKYFKKEWNLLRIDTSEMTRVLFVQLLKNIGIRIR